MSEKSEIKPNTVWREFVELFWTLLWALVIALFLRTLFFQPFHIPSASMYPQLLIGDYLVSSKYPYGYSKYSLPLAPNLFSGRILEQTPKQGDIAVFKWPRDNRTDFIKRVIGMPGDRVQMRDGRLWINNQQVPVEMLGEEIVTVGGQQQRVARVRETLPNGKSYITWDRGRSDYDNTPVEIVPYGHFFMMGDNRDNSLDSRVWGVVSAEALIGRAEIVLISVNEEFRLLKPWTWANFRKRGFVSLRSDR